MNFEGKVAFITGGASGLGKAAVSRLVELGAAVAAFDMNSARLQAVQSEIEATHADAKIMSITGDISQPDDLKIAYQQVQARFGRLDYLFANAGINGVWASVTELEDDEFRKTIDVNLNGTFYTIKYAVPYMLEKGGSIVVTASVNGTRMFSNTGLTAYSAAKAGQSAMAKMLALELAPQGIRVNIICPGAIATDIISSTTRRNLDKIRYPADFPAGKIPLTHGQHGKAEDVAKVVTFLFSDDAAHVSGTEIWIDGTQSLLMG